MKLTRVTIVLVFALINFASLCFAANDFQVNGTVKTINTNGITVTDDKGKEITFEGTASNLKAGDRVVIKAQINKVEVLRTDITTQDIEFLTKQCLIDQADVDIIPQLPEQGRGQILSSVDKNDCKLAEPFKVSRKYFRQLDINKVIPLPPAMWKTYYLTSEEYKQYMYLLENAPW